MKKQNLIKHAKQLTLLLGISLIFCGCTKKPVDTDKPSKPGNETVDTPQDPNQSKLDVLRPSAYGDIEGLNLEPGSCISIIGRYEGDSYWKQVEEGAKKAIDDLNKALGYKGDKKIKLSFCAPDVRDDVDEQISILDEELAREPIAICIAAVDTTACAVQFDLAAENNTPIITFDSGSDYQNITAHVATNNREAAETAAINMGALLEGTGEIAVFVQDSFSMTAKDRKEAFLNKINADYPNVSVVNVYHFDALETMAQQIAAEKNAGLTEDQIASGENVFDAATVKQEDVIKYILEKNPNLKGIYATNLDTTQLVAKVINSLDNKKNYQDNFHFIGFDGGEEQIKLLENNTVDGLIFQNPYGMGYATVVAAARTVLNLGNEAVIDSGYTWVTKDTMKKSEISKMLY